MGRQTTLGQYTRLRFETLSEVSSGKYIDVPKGMKPAPPQQSTLGEMWGKKKKREPEVKVEQENKMDVDKTGARSQ